MVFATIAALFTGSGAKAADPLDEMDRIVFEVCPDLFDGSLDFQNAVNWKQRGLSLGAPDKSGTRQILKAKDFSIAIRTNETNQVCHVTYSGPDSEMLYETGLQRLQQKGYAFVQGERKSPEAEFMMDTLATETGPVGVVTMFRVHIVPNTRYIMTAMATPAE